MKDKKYIILIIAIIPDWVSLRNIESRARKTHIFKHKFGFRCDIKNQTDDK